MLTKWKKSMLHYQKQGQRGVGTRENPGFSSRTHQQALTTSPFRNTYEEDAVSPKVAMGELQDRDVYNQGNTKWIQCKNNTTPIYQVLA
jgi:hypothetical protein